MAGAGVAAGRAEGARERAAVLAAVPRVGAATGAAADQHAAALAKASRQPQRHRATEQQRQRPNSELKTLLGELFTKKMANLLAEQWFVSKPLKQYIPSELAEIAEQLGNWTLVPAGTEGYRTAEVTLGGIDTREVSSKTMESQKSPGLYFIGEVLDVTGHLGGFNFQWAWASAYAAAQFV